VICTAFPQWNDVIAMSGFCDVIGRRFVANTQRVTPEQLAPLLL
jgi:hypothetical protein